MRNESSRPAWAIYVSKDNPNPQRRKKEAAATEKLIRIFNGFTRLKG
jgi:hypothetical protein